MKVSKLRDLVKKQSDKLHLKGVGIQFTRKGIIVEAAINNDMNKVNSLFNIIKTFLVNEGFKIDEMKVVKTNKTQRSLYVINEALYLIKEGKNNDEMDEEIEDEIVSTSEIDEETGEVLDTTTDEMDDEQYVDYVLGSATPTKSTDDLLPDDEDSIQLLLADDIDELETDIVDEEESGETKTIDINAHEGVGPLPESRFRRRYDLHDEENGSDDFLNDLVDFYIKQIVREYDIKNNPETITAGEAWRWIVANNDIEQDIADRVDYIKQFHNIGQAIKEIDRLADKLAFIFEQNWESVISNASGNVYDEYDEDYEDEENYSYDESYDEGYDEDDEDDYDDDYDNDYKERERRYDDDYDEDDEDEEIF